MKEKPDGGRRTKKIWKRKSNPTQNSFKKRRFYARIMPLWDACVKK